MKPDTRQKEKIQKIIQDCAKQQSLDFSHNTWLKNEEPTEETTLQTKQQSPDVSTDRNSQSKKDKGRSATKTLYQQQKETTDKTKNIKPKRPRRRWPQSLKMKPSSRALDEATLRFFSETFLDKPFLEFNEESPLASAALNELETKGFGRGAGTRGLDLSLSEIEATIFGISTTQPQSHEEAYNEVPPFSSTGALFNEHNPAALFSQDSFLSTGHSNTNRTETTKDDYSRPNTPEERDDNNANTRNKKSETEQTKQNNIFQRSKTQTEATNTKPTTLNRSPEEKPSNPKDSARKGKQAPLSSHNTFLSLETKSLSSEGPRLVLFDAAPWPSDMRGMPNDYARSALFTVRNKRVAREARQAFTIFHINEDVSISYTGLELRAEDDELVWQQVLHYARRVAAGDPVFFTFYRLCSDLGWSLNGRYYARAERCLSRLQASAMRFSSTRLGRVESVSLLRRFRVRARGSRHSRCEVEIDPEMVLLFAQGGHTRLIWEKYRKLSPIARRMYDYFSSHKKPWPIKLETFRNLCGSDSSRMAKWREQVNDACCELRQSGLVNDVSIIKNLLSCRHRGNLVEPKAARGGKEEI